MDGGFFSDVMAQMSEWLTQLSYLGLQIIVWLAVLMVYAFLGFFIGSRFAKEHHNGDNLTYATLGMILAVFLAFPLTVYFVAQ